MVAVLAAVPLLLCSCAVLLAGLKMGVDAERPVDALVILSITVTVFVAVVWFSVVLLSTAID